MESSHPSFRTVPYSVCLSIERDRMDEDFNKGAKWIPDFIKTPYIIQYFLCLLIGAACAAAWGHPPTLTQQLGTPPALARC
jgi:hypothetical protein